MALITSTHSVINTMEEATALAYAMTADDDGWQYVAVADPAGSGRATIEIFDEDGEFVGIV
jgi:hypothetical protein